MFSDPINFNIGTSVNGNSNYNVGMSIDPSLFNAAQQAYDSILNGTGGGAGYGMMAAGGGGIGTAGRLDQGPVSQEVQRNQLMSEQLNQLIARDSPYIQRARADAQGIASRRGLMNSAIMAGASHGAAIDRAAPIAQFDAARYGSVADQNMAAEAQHREQQARVSAAGAGASASYNNAAAQRKHDLDRMLFGHALGSLDDYRRHGLGIETREDGQSFQAGQADIDRLRDDQRFWLHQSPLAWSQFDHGAGMDMRNFGLQQDQLGFQNRQLDAQMYQSQFGPMYNNLAAIYSNPNLTADQMNQAAQNMMNMGSGIANQAWASIPQGLFNPSAISAAQTLPPMPPLNIRRGG